MSTASASRALDVPRIGLRRSRKAVAASKALRGTGNKFAKRVSSLTEQSHGGNVYFGFHQDWRTPCRFPSRYICHCCIRRRCCCQLARLLLFFYCDSSRRGRTSTPSWPATRIHATYQFSKPSMSQDAIKCRQDSPWARYRSLPACCCSLWGLMNIWQRFGITSSCIGGGPAESKGSKGKTFAGTASKEEAMLGDCLPGWHGLVLAASVRRCANNAERLHTRTVLERRLSAFLCLSSPAKHSL